MEDEEVHCLKVEWLQMPESIRRDTMTLATAMDSKLEESDLSADVEQDEDKLKENDLVLEES